MDNQRILSWCHNDIGILLVQEGKTTEALTAFEASRRIKQKIADDHPDVAEYRRDLAISHHNIGSVLRESGRLTEALAAHEAALAIQRTLADAYPAVTAIQRDLANSLNEIGDVLRLMGRPAEARPSYEQALAILEGTVQGGPDRQRKPRVAVAGPEGPRGHPVSPPGRTADAVATWRRAIAIGERLRSPYDEPFYYLAGCHALLGGSRRRAGLGSLGRGRPGRARAGDGHAAPGDRRRVSRCQLDAARPGPRPAAVAAGLPGL